MKNTKKHFDMYVVGILFIVANLGAATIQAAELDVGTFTIDIHGFVSQGYLKSDHNNFLADTEEGTFEFREYGLNVSLDPLDQLHGGAQLFGRDFGDYGNDEIILDWAVADFRFQDWLGIRAGRMKGVFGLYNETRDIDLVRTTIFLPQSLYNDAWRDSFLAVDGVGLYGTLAAESLGSLSYQAQWGKIKIEPDSGVSKYLIEFVPIDITAVETSEVYAIGIEWVPAPPLDGLRLRFTWDAWDMDHKAVTNLHPSWQFQEIPPGVPVNYHSDLSVRTLSVEYRWDDLVLAAETILPDNFDYRFDSPLLGVLDSGTSDIVGYYASAAYSFTEWLELGVLYSEYYNDADDKDGKRHSALTGYPPYNAWLKDAAVTVRFDVLENWIIKVEGHKMNGTDIMLMADNPDGTKEDWMLFGAKITYNF